MFCFLLIKEYILVIFYSLLMQTYTCALTMKEIPVIQYMTLFFFLSNVDFDDFDAYSPICFGLVTPSHMFVLPLFGQK